MEPYSIPATERAMKVQEVILRALSGQLKWYQAAEILGISDRSMRRWRRRYETHGYDGLYDRRQKRPSPKRVPLRVAEQVLRLYRERYFDFNVQHFHEELRTRHGLRLGYSWVKAALQGAGLVPQRHTRGPHRRRRPRRPLPGMLLHQDGSRHAWLPERPPLDLVVTMDDAHSRVYTAEFVPEETTEVALRHLKQVVTQQGLFCALYTDRGSQYVTTRSGQSPHQPQHAQGPTQVDRALKELGIQLILAHSPEARGRMERLFGTWQGRLPQEFRLRGIRTVPEANRFLQRGWVPKHNRTWTVPAAQPGTAFVPCPRRDLDRVFSLQHERVVAADNTVQFGRVIFQLARAPWRVSFAKCRVTVYQHLDGKIEIGYGPHPLGWYEPDGRPLKTAMAPGA